jgi:CRP/FNR family transcriptional regulator, cyclic AMP receptor protein
VLRADAKLELLQRIPLFAGCSKRELKEIAAIADELDLPAGKTLIAQGEPGRQFFILVEGDVEVRRNGRKLPGKDGLDFFGEIALLVTSETTATVKATSPVRVLVITPRHFRSLLKRSPAIQAKVLNALARRLAPETV